MKLREIQYPDFNVQPIIARLTRDLAAVGIKDPSYLGGFCFHAAARIFDALRDRYPEHDLTLLHMGGHVFVYDRQLSHSFDAFGSYYGEGNGVTRRLDHSWGSTAAMLRFLHRHELKPEIVKGLTVL